ncbi:MAG: RNA degradosome polyphosphate kinase [Oscillospiraceae bacterium]|nr:RNA degradosome polyphosphate kinase [Oscillospiraceae bacterium]
MDYQNQSFPYINRELSWLDFNSRVLDEALEKENPLMERIRFLAISESNLDEFFMVRVAGVKAQVLSDYTNEDVSGFTPQKLLEELQKKIHDFTEKQYSCWQRSIVPALKKQNISFLTPEEMNEEQLSYISQYFDKILFPVLTPLAVDPSRPFPHLANKSLNIAVHLKDEQKESCFAVVQAPSILPRFLKIPSPEGQSQFTLLEDIIIYRISSLFELHKIKACTLFRITRNSDLNIDEDTDDLLQEIEKSIKKRKRGRPIRLQLIQKCDKQTKNFLTDSLKVKSDEIYEVPGPIDLTFLGKFASQSEFKDLCFAPVVPMYPAADFVDSENIFDTIKEKDRMLHHPYESFQTVVDFIRAAAVDEDVLAIKQTLYRVSGNSPIIASLIKAAENGKQVTVLVELKARFDEENNIHWAKKLENAGCHVIYGLQGLKTHCKITLVVRKEEDGIRRYVHMGTGNYNDSTAKIYTDLSVFTCSEPFGADASSLFNVLTGYSMPPEYNKFAVAPHGLRSFFERRIEKEIQNAKNGIEAGIVAKVNSLVDPKIIEQLYEASKAGVKIQLIVRGICCLVPGIPGLSDNISVHSIVGQLLEHSRIWMFENGGDKQIFMGSADWMQRNLNRRVELVFPIEDEDLKDRTEHILMTMLNDTVNTRILLPSGEYKMIDRRGKVTLNCQTYFAKEAKQRADELKRVDWSEGFKPQQNPNSSKQRNSNDESE